GQPAVLPTASVLDMSLPAARARLHAASLLLSLILLLLAIASCGGEAASTTSAAPSPSPSPAPAPSPGPGASPAPPPGSPSTSLGRADHVVIVIFENQDYATVIGSPAMPYLNGLASRFALATNFFANTHPSQPNYFMLTTGQLISASDSFVGVVDVDNVVRQLVKAGKTWKSYAESLPSVGYVGGDVLPYVKRHNPFAYISDVINNPLQIQNLVPFSQFQLDMAAGQLPNYSFIIPNQVHNAHDCPDGSAAGNCPDAVKLAAADDWLRVNIDPLLANPQFQQSGLLIVTWDEASFADSTHGG